VAVAAATMYGLSVFEYAAEYETGRQELLRWFREGKLKRGETIIKGSIADAPQALAEMYNGSNVGKLLIQVKDI
jgi:NADPH-dependent curcumin reductase CurA